MSTRHITNIHGNGLLKENLKKRAENRVKRKLYQKRAESRQAKVVSILSIFLFVQQYMCI